MQKWEMLSYIGRSISMHSPTNSISLSDDEFIQKFINPKHKAQWNPPSADIIFQWLLENGWQPYSHSNGYYYFRRKIEISDE